MPPVERWYVLSSVVQRYISFIVSGTSMNYISLYHQWYGDISLSCLQWNVGMCYRQWYGGTSLSSSVVRRCISLSPSVERWCILLSSSSVVRRCISPSTSSGTLVVHLQWNVGVFCYFHRQWYVDVFLFNTFSGTLVCVIVSGTAIHLFLPPVGRW